MKVFICFTPLHVLISEKIIEQETIKKYLFIYFSSSDNKKNQYYFKKLSKNAVESYYILLRNSFIYDLKLIINLSSKIRKYKDIQYYSGKIKSSHNRLLMSFTRNHSFCTFDDGSGNISGSGYFYSDNENIFFKIYFTIFNKKLVYKNIKASEQLHYTIFNLPNVFPNRRFLNLFDDKNQNIITNRKNMVILLTNAFAEDGEMPLIDEIQLYKKILKKYNVTHTIKHPREKLEKINSNTITEIKSMKIAEEIILEYSKIYTITVIGIYSTTLLNLININNLKLINISAIVKKPVKGISDLLRNSGVDSIEI